MNIIYTNEFGEVIFNNKAYGITEDSAKTLAREIYKKYPNFDSDILKKNMYKIADMSANHKMFISFIIECLLDFNKAKDGNSIIHPYNLFSEKKFEFIKSQNKVKPEVRFEYWVDPLRTAKEDVVDALLEEEIEEGTLDMDGEEILGEFLQLPEMPYTEKDINVVPMETMIATPFGFSNISNQNLLSNHFNFWVGHTNFDLSKDYISIITEVNGVESLDVYTRYRFRVGIGRLFQANVVLSQIQKAMIKHEKQKRKHSF